MADDVTTDVPFPETPAGQQAAWFYRHAKTRGADLTVEEVAEHMSFEPPWQPENSLERFREDRPDPGRTIVEMNTISPSELEFFEVDGSKRRWRVVFRVEEAHPHRITFCDWRADLGPGVIMRLATPADTRELAEVERRAPIVTDGVSQTYDRGDDFLAFTRLMEQDAFYVVEKDGEIVGMYGAASHMVSYEGNPKRAMLYHHLRIRSDQEKRGYFSALNVQLFDHYAEIYGPWWKEDAWAVYAYIKVANAAAQRLGGPGSWSFGPLRASLPCAELAGDDYGREATPDDAEAIIEIMNSCHRDETTYLPYTAAFLEERLSRAPDLYSWSNILVGKKAVLGVWPSGLRVTIRDGDDSRTAVRACALDVGFLDGAEDELEALIRSWCARLVRSGMTELSFITSEGSPGYTLIERLASTVDAFDYKMTLPEPEGAAANGLYVDPIYF